MSKTDKIPFDPEKPWSVDDLPPDVKEKILADLELDPTAAYIDLGGEIIEVPRCPYCLQGTYDVHRCEHVVFDYDLTNGEYITVKDSLGKFLAGPWASSAKGTDPEAIAATLAALAEGTLPLPVELAGAVDGLVFQEIWDQSGCHGRGYGYASPELCHLLSIR